ncbi:type II toxin-antitoxin system antitoxin SocA domain-containing protein [Limosilactobacillus reuteri]|uniref:type II toxin-antitoxin system antitoxin SocA domain-containing protein n=1 Tax=Limosilactobacillus reuteri TaxID=1598 RepID=UPI00214B2BC7|nr:DUF4065 domain-containing protein [Limosilactobacillus reuteri]
MSTLKGIVREEVAGYLKTHFNLHAFPFQKVLYYSYADYLESKGHRLFLASFQAFDHGPVERKVWRKAQDNLKELQEKNYDFIQKAALILQLRNLLIIQSKNMLIFLILDSDLRI